MFSKSSKKILWAERNTNEKKKKKTLKGLELTSDETEVIVWRSSEGKALGKAANCSCVTMEKDGDDTGMCELKQKVWKLRVRNKELDVECGTAKWTCLGIDKSSKKQGSVNRPAGRLPWDPCWKTYVQGYWSFMYVFLFLMWMAFFFSEKTPQDHPIDKELTKLMQLLIKNKLVPKCGDKENLVNPLCLRERMAMQVTNLYLSYNKVRH